MGKPSRSCCVRGCKSTQTRNPDLKFHHSPRPAGRCKLWVQAACNDKVAEVPIAKISKSGFRLCSRHFSTKQYADPSKKLIKDAIPDLDLPHELCNVYSGEPCHNFPDEISNPSSLQADFYPIPSTSSDVPFSSELVPSVATPLSLPSMSTPSGSIQHISLKGKKTVGQRSLLQQFQLDDCELTPRKKKMFGALHKTRRNLLRAKKTSQNLREVIRKRKELIAQFLSEEFPPWKSLFMISMLNTNVNPQSRRWTMEEKSLYLSMYKKCPRAYAYFRNFGHLPSKRTRITLLSSVMLPPGLNSPIILNLAAHASNFLEKNKYCSLV